MIGYLFVCMYVFEVCLNKHECLRERERERERERDPWIFTLMHLQKYVTKIHINKNTLKYTYFRI